MYLFSSSSDLSSICALQGRSSHLTVYGILGMEIGVGRRRLSISLTVSISDEISTSKTLHAES